MQCVLMKMGFATVLLISSLAGSEVGQRYTLKGPSPVPSATNSTLSLTAGVAGTVATQSALDTISPKGVQWEMGALYNLDAFSVYGSVAFQHGIGSAVYEVLTDSTKTGTLKNYTYGSPKFSLEALKEVVSSRSFALTLGIGGTVGMEFGQQFMSYAKADSGKVAKSPTNPFGGSFYGTVMESFPSGSFSAGMYQRIHWNWVESQAQTTSATSPNGFKLIEQGFSATFKRMHRIHAAVGVNLVKEPTADFHYPISFAMGYTWIGRIKK